MCEVEAFFKLVLIKAAFLSETKLWLGWFDFSLSLLSALLAIFLTFFAEQVPHYAWNRTPPHTVAPDPRRSVSRVLQPDSLSQGLGMSFLSSRSRSSSSSFKEAVLSLCPLTHCQVLRNSGCGCSPPHTAAQREHGSPTCDLAFFPAFHI